MSARLCLSLFLFSVAAVAAPLTRDLGRNLAFYRIHSLPADLPPNDGRKQPCVLDLRYVDQWSLAFDFWILLRTVPAVLLGRGAR